MQSPKHFFFFIHFFCFSFFLGAQSNFTLSQALQSARLNNLFLKTEHYNINLAQSNITTARLRPNPILNNQTLQLIRPSVYPANTDFLSGKNRQTWWQLTKPMQLPLQRQYKIELANQNLKATEKNYVETERNLFVLVAGKWLEVWTTQKQLDIIAVARRNLDSLVLINRLRLKDQVITQTDLLRTELLAAKYELQYKTARQEVTNRQKELRFLMGVTDSVAIDLNENFSPNAILNMDSLLNQAVQNRSDVQAIQAGISVANSNINLQKSLAIPQPEIGVIFNPQNGIPYLGFYGTIKLPFFDRNQGQINQAFVLKTQSEQQLLAVRTQIQTEITTAFNRYQLQRQNVQQFETILIQSRTILDNVQYAYLRGGTTIIDFLEAQRSWLETQQQYYDALQSYRQSYIQLLYTTGLINQLAQ